MMFSNDNSASIYLHMVWPPYPSSVDQPVYRTPSRTLSQLEKYKFSGETINHWLGRCNCIKRTTTLLPSPGHFSKYTYDAILLRRYGLRLTSCGHNSKWALFDLWYCRPRCAV
jgi:hypothetical protein